MCKNKKENDGKEARKENRTVKKRGRRA